MVEMTGVTTPRIKHDRVTAIMLAVLLVTVVVASSAAAQGVEGMSLGQDQLSLRDIETAPETSTDSTIVELPIPITLRAPKDGKFGIRLRLSVFFSWNNVRIEEIEGEDIADSGDR